MLLASLWVFVAVVQCLDEETYMVRYKDELSYTEKVEARAFLRTQLGGAAKAAGADSFNNIREYSIFNGFSGSFSPELASMLAQHPSFERVEPDIVVRVATPFFGMVSNESAAGDDILNSRPQAVSSLAHSKREQGSEPFMFRGAGILGCANSRNSVPLQYYFNGSTGYLPSYENCITSCQLALNPNGSQGFRFAAAGKNDCYCGDEFDNIKGSDECNLPCKGNPLENCGNENSIIILGPLDQNYLDNAEQTNHTNDVASEKDDKQDHEQTNNHEELVDDEASDNQLSHDSNDVKKYDTQGWAALRVLGYDIDADNTLKIGMPVCTKPQSEVYVYVIDSGINIYHPELIGYAKCGISIFDDNCADVLGHGTHVASNIVGASIGLAKRTNVIAVKVVGNDGIGSSGTMIAGLEWVKKQISLHRKPSLVNISLTSDLVSLALNEAISKLAELVTVVVAAGNDKQNACNASPGAARAAITVGATGVYRDKKMYPDRIAKYSNYGPCVDIFAPGSFQIGAFSDDSVRKMSGTSVAAPIVTSVLALLLEQRQHATPKELEQRLFQLTKPDVKGRLHSAENRLLQIDPKSICDLWN